MVNVTLRENETYVIRLQIGQQLYLIVSGQHIYNSNTITVLGQNA